jgi:hypothetical protein
VLLVPGGSAAPVVHGGRRPGISPAQFYQLLHPTNYRKSVDGSLSLLQVLDCEIEVMVKP